MTRQVKGGKEEKERLSVIFFSLFPFYGQLLANSKLYSEKERAK